MFKYAYNYNIKLYIKSLCKNLRNLILQMRGTRIFLCRLNGFLESFQITLDHNINSFPRENENPQSSAHLPSFIIKLCNQIQAFKTPIIKFECTSLHIIVTSYDQSTIKVFSLINLHPLFVFRGGHDPAAFLVDFCIDQNSNVSISQRIPSINLEFFLYSRYYSACANTDL